MNFYNKHTQIKSVFYIFIHVVKETIHSTIFIKVISIMLPDQLLYPVYKVVIMFFIITEHDELLSNYFRAAFCAVPPVYLKNSMPVQYRDVNGGFCSLEIVRLQIIFCSKS